MMNYGYPPSQHPLEEIRRFFRQRSALPVLILINVAVWALVQAGKVIFFFLNHPGGVPFDTIMLRTFGLPAFLSMLESRPWTLVTYMFFHTDVWHILFNMLWLYWFGKIFLAFLSPRTMVWVYLLGGLAGGLLYVLAFNVFPVFESILPNSWALGASASVMAIVTAAAVYAPDYTIQLFLIGRLKIIWLAAILFVFDFFLIPSGNAGGHLAHIGGALFGAAYVLIYRRAGARGWKTPWAGLFAGMSGMFKGRGRPNAPSDGRPERPLTDDEYNRRRNETQRKVDEILEKIARGGYESLSKEEKEFLFRTSNKR